jgi:cytochrome P450
VSFLWAEANRDEREFERADVFNAGRLPGRSQSSDHSIHRQLGYLEGRVLLEELLASRPTTM